MARVTLLQAINDALKTEMKRKTAKEFVDMYLDMIGYSLARGDTEQADRRFHHARYWLEQVVEHPDTNVSNCTIDGDHRWQITRPREA